MNRNYQKASKRRYYARYLAGYTKRNYAILGMGLLFLAGVLGGTLLLKSADGETVELLMRLVGGFVEKRQTQTFPEVFAASATSSLLFVGGLFLCGFCAVGQPAEILAPLFRGLGFGFSVSSLYAGYGASAAGYVGLFLLPNMLISTVVILFCCRESLRMSGSLFSALRGGEGYKMPLRLYLARYIVAAGICLSSALLEAFTYSSFANYFTLS